VTDFGTRFHQPALGASGMVRIAMPEVAVSELGRGNSAPGSDDKARHLLEDEPQDCFVWACAGQVQLDLGLPFDDAGGVSAPDPHPDHRRHP